MRNDQCIFVRLMRCLLALFIVCSPRAGCLTFFCPCVTFGRIAGIVDQGATSCCASGALYFLLSAAAGLDERGVRAEGGAGHPALEEVVWATAATGVRQQKGLYSPASMIRCTI